MKNRQKLWSVIPVCFILFLVLLNFKRITPRMIKELKIFLPPQKIVFSSDQLKLRHKIAPEVLDYYEFIKGNTPEDAKILIPPQGFPWPMTGNAAYSRYFLYPRHLINGKEKEAGLDLKKENIQYVLVIWGESEGLEYDFTHGWPKFSVPAQKIIYKKPTDLVFNYEKVITQKDFDPKEAQKEWWGIIEVDRGRL